MHDGWRQPARAARRHRDGARRCRGDDQARREEDRRRARRRSRAERAAGRRRARRARAAGGLGGGEGLDAQQADPGAAGARAQRAGAMGRDAGADDRRRLPVLRGLREARAPFPAQRRRRRRAREALEHALRRPRHRPGRLREGQDTRRHPHRLHPLRRDHRDRAGHGAGGVLCAPGRRGHGGRGGDDRGRLRLRGRHREDGRRRHAAAARRIERLRRAGSSAPSATRCCGSRRG